MQMPCCISHGESWFKIYKCVCERENIKETIQMEVEVKKSRGKIRRS